MIKFAETEEEILNCFAVLSPLRPHLSFEEFSVRFQRLSNKTNYKLVYLYTDNIKAVAGIRISEWLHTGKYLEIEELITAPEERSKGFGGALFDWILAYAKEQECSQLRLISGNSRERAHQFYLDKGMIWEAKYFSIDVC